MDSLLSAFSQFVTTYFGNVVEMIQSVEIIIGICFAVLGVATSILARRITRIIRKRNEVLIETESGDIKDEKYEVLILDALKYMLDNRVFAKKNMKKKKEKG